MKTTLALVTLALLVSLPTAHAAPAWTGAWHATDASTERVLLVVDGYWTHTTYNRTEPQFHRTFGGPFAQATDQLTATIHFDSAEPARVGQTLALHAVLTGDTLSLRLGDAPAETWQRIPETPAPLAGAWRITGRQRDGQIESLPLRPRRTLKILTGSRFQWIAMNIETGEFSGTGGGSYTFADGTYTENIEFFSRDATRVGAQLAFQGEIKDASWHHSGLSSRGDPIYEIWSKLESPPKKSGAAGNSGYPPRSETPPFYVYPSLLAPLSPRAIQFPPSGIIVQKVL